MWFQQDGATAHTANESVTIVRNMFPGHLISRFGDVPWPPRSPDLSACDFFLWGHLKSRVYAHKPRTLNDLKEAIRQEIRPIDRQLLARVMDYFKLVPPPKGVHARTFCLSTVLICVCRITRLIDKSTT